MSVSDYRAAILGIHDAGDFYVLIHPSAPRHRVVFVDRKGRVLAQIINVDGIEPIEQADGSP